MKLIFFCLLISLSIFSAIPTDKENQRIVNKKLSDIDHDADVDHNQDYDHEAFLGKDEAKEFDELSPEESKKRLGIIFIKIDQDGDNYLTKDELIKWIKYVQSRYALTETSQQWEEHVDIIHDGKISWNDYKTSSYGNDDNEEESTKNIIKRDERRWKQADLNNDGSLTKDEFLNFLHPEEAENMKDVVVDETLEDIDKNDDGKISLDEYIDDLWPEDQRDQNMPDWVEEEKIQFSNNRDKNNDGFMDKNEIKDWILPQDYDHSDSEAAHLIDEADADKDGKLSKDEVLLKQDVFAGSQATDFGEILNKHDEF